MMRAALRSGLSVLAGFVVANLANLAGGLINAALFPALARAVAANDAAALATAVDETPGSGLALVVTLLAWAIGSAAGGAVAARLAPRARVAHGVAVGALFLVGGIANNLAFPPPTWFWVATGIVFVPCAWLGARAANADRPIAP